MPEGTLRLVGAQAGLQGANQRSGKQNNQAVSLKKETGLTCCRISSRKIGKEASADCLRMRHELKSRSGFQLMHNPG